MEGKFLHSVPGSLNIQFLERIRIGIVVVHAHHVRIFRFRSSA